VHTVVEPSLRSDPESRLRDHPEIIFVAEPILIVRPRVEKLPKGVAIFQKIDRGQIAIEMSEVIAAVDPNADRALRGKHAMALAENALNISPRNVFEDVGAGDISHAVVTETRITDRDRGSIMNPENIELPEVGNLRRDLAN